MHIGRLVQAGPLIEEKINRRFDPRNLRSIFLRALADCPMRRNNDHIGCFEAATPGSGHDTDLPHKSQIARQAAFGTAAFRALSQSAISGCQMLAKKLRHTCQRGTTASPQCQLFCTIQTSSSFMRAIDRP
jgi:hypothetical protein